MLEADQKLYAFPRLARVQLHAFSLYRLKPDASVAFDKGVVCMAGANGIGKSTFLATVNYGLTGAVPHPRRRLLSASAYYKEASDYSREFFNGRIDEGDRPEAAITVEFEIKGRVYRVRRALFDPEDVQYLEIDGEIILPGSGSGLQRSEKYRTQLTEDMGLSSFEQFVFLQHFVLTFDESRHLLFWNVAATGQTLFLCFGGNPDEAAEADFLFREAERAGSRGRNLQFQVNNVRKRIEAISGTLSVERPLPVETEDLEAQYISLEGELLSATEKHERSESLLSETEAQVIQASARVAQKRASYTDAFNSFLNRSGHAKSHPLISRLLSEANCGVCGSTESGIVQIVSQKLDSGICPLCGTELAGPVEDETKVRERLAVADSDLGEARKSLDAVTATQTRLQAEVREARARLLSARKNLTDFEEKNVTAADYLKKQRLIQTGPVAETLRALETSMAEFTRERDAAYAERDLLRDRLKELQKSLQRRYALAEETFVPRFRQLAELFLGIDLDVSMQLVAPMGLKLIVELRGSERRDEDQMSESQRFFVDIALRMSLLQQMSEQGAQASMFVDTPEGSLDIAYEDRAGEMFASFVESGHDLLMTANINSSKLLTTLAKRCGSKSMKIYQMTGWTELSDVQQNATGLFQEAFQEIETALQAGPTAA